MIECITVLVICYLIGSVPFGFLIAKAKGVDIRTVGSGNIGATNVLRTFGKKFGIPCFFLDFLKGLLPVLLTIELACNEYAPICAVAGTVLGHVFTLFLKFKGGKGVATTAGALTGLAPAAVGSGILIWFITLKITGYVSLGSIIAALILPLLIWFDLFGQNTIQEKYFFIIMGFLVVYRHRTNIQRLLKGEENSFKKKGK